MNTIAGIYLCCDPGGELKNTTIGASGAITLNNNGSTSGPYAGGAAVLVYGACDQTTITANVTNSLSTATAGLVVVGTDALGTNSPTNTVAKIATLQDLVPLHLQER